MYIYWQPRNYVNKLYLQYNLQEKFVWTTKRDEEKRLAIPSHN
jgi:hypothetical protein